MASIFMGDGDDGKLRLINGYLREFPGGTWKMKWLGGVSIVMTYKSTVLTPFKDGSYTQ